MEALHSLVLDIVRHLEQYRGIHSVYPKAVLLDEESFALLDRTLLKYKGRCIPVKEVSTMHVNEIVGQYKEQTTVEVLKKMHELADDLKRLAEVLPVFEDVTSPEAVSVGRLQTKLDQIDNILVMK